MTNFIWVNGAYLPDDKPAIFSTDRGFLCGDGVFETLRVYHGMVFKLSEHLERLTRSARGVKIPLPVSRRSFEKAINKLLKLNNLTEARVRITVTRGRRLKGYNPGVFRCSELKPTVVIEIEPCPNYTEEWEKGVKVIVAPHRRSIESPFYQYKTLNYMENVLARNEANRRKSFESIFINTRNEVTEGTMSNIFVVKRGRVFTPPLSANILAGVTRRTVFGLCTSNATKVREKTLRLKDVSKADEVFLTGSIMEIMPVVECEGKAIGNGKPGKVTCLLQQTYRELTYHC